MRDYLERNHGKSMDINDITWLSDCNHPGIDQNSAKKHETYYKESAPS